MMGPLSAFLAMVKKEVKMLELCRESPPRLPRGWIAVGLVK